MWKLPPETCNIHESKVKHDEFVSASRNLIQTTRAQMSRMNEMSSHIKYLADQIQDSRRPSVDKIQAGRRPSVDKVLASRRPSVHKIQASRRPSVDKILASRRPSVDGTNSRRNSILQYLTHNKNERRNSSKDEEEMIADTARLITIGRRASVFSVTERNSSDEQNTKIKKKTSVTVIEQPTDVNLYEDYERKCPNFRLKKYVQTKAKNFSSTKATASRDSNNNNTFNVKKKSAVSNTVSNKTKRQITVSLEKDAHHSKAFSKLNATLTEKCTLFPLEVVRRSVTPRKPLAIPKINVGSHVIRPESPDSLNMSFDNGTSSWSLPGFIMRPLIDVYNKSHD